MANKYKSKFWPWNAYPYLETNYERFDSRINLGFYVAIGILTAVWSLFISGAVSYMNTLAGIVLMVSFWTTIVLGSLVFRNSGKVQVNQKLTNMETKLTDIGTKVDTLIESQNKLIDHIDKLINRLERDNGKQ